MARGRANRRAPSSDAAPRPNAWYGSLAAQYTWLCAHLRGGPGASPPPHRNGYSILLYLLGPCETQGHGTEPVLARGQHGHVCFAKVRCARPQLQPHMRARLLGHGAEDGRASSPAARSC